MSVNTITYQFKDNFDWIKYCKDIRNKEFVYDLVQKVFYSVQDLNNEINLLNNASMKDVIYVISLVCWIHDGVEKINNYITNDIKEDKNFNIYKKFLKAIRSFVLAYPLETDRYSEFGLDGNKICVDVRKNLDDSLICSDIDFYSLRIDGYNKLDEFQEADFYLSVYTRKDNYKEMQFVGCYFEDLYNVAQLNIDKLEEIERNIQKGNYNE